MSRIATPRDLIPDAHHVLGTVLRPFSLGHHLLLTKVGSPFVNQPAAPAPAADLAMAVFICGAPYFALHESLVRGEWEDEFKRWLARLKPHWWQPSRFAHETELEKFQAYLATGYARPPVWRHDLPATIELTAPDECLLKCKLVRAGFSAAAVLETYLPAAWYDYYTLCELDQAENLTNPAKWRSVFYTEQAHARLHPEIN